MAITFLEEKPSRKIEFIGNDPSPKPSAKNKISFIDENKPEEKEKQALIWTVLDNINRPQYAVANVINDAVDGGDFTPLKSMWDGLTLKEKKSVSDSLTEMGWKPESKVGKTAKFLVGFAGDVLTDPLTYTGVGLATKSGKLLKGSSTAARYAKAAKVAGKADNITNTLTFAGKKLPGEKIVDAVFDATGKASRSVASKVYDNAPIIEKTIDKIGSTLSTKYRPRSVDPVKWEKFITATEKAKNLEGSIKLNALEKAQKIKSIFNEHGLNKKDISEITDLIEKGTKVNFEGGKVAQEFTEELTQKYANVGKTGKKIIEEDGYKYLPHILDKKASKVRKSLGMSKREFTTTSPSDIKRTLVKYGDNIVSTKTGKVFNNGDEISKLDLDVIKQIDADGLFSQATIKEINTALPEPIFSGDLSKLVYVQGQRTAKVVGGDTLFKEAAKLGKSKKAYINQGYEELLQEGRKVLVKGKKVRVQPLAPEMRGQYFDADIAKHIDEVYHKLTNVDQVNEIVKVYDKVQNAWKATATFWNPAFHTRNAISNVWQNSLAGVRDPRDYIKATKIQKLSNTPEALSEAERVLLKEFKEQGLSSAGWMSGDISKSINQSLMTISDHIKKKDILGTINKAGGMAGEAVENNAKLAHFIAKRREGLSAFDAGRSVKKHLFDYADLTRTEKEIFKRALPFYTWSRKNIPLQLEKLITNPSGQSKLVKLKNNVEVLTGDDKATEILPEWLKNATPIFIGQSKDKKQRYVKMEGFLPTTDLARLYEDENNLNLVKDMFQMINPIGKALLEQSMNQNFFYGSEIQKYKGQKKDFLMMKIPARMEHLAKLFRPLSEIDKIIGKKYSDMSSGAKAMNLLFGGKVYEYDVKELLRRYGKLTEQDALAIKGEINFLRKEINQKPSKRESNLRDIKILTTLMRESKKEAANAKRRARRIVWE